MMICPNDCTTGATGFRSDSKGLTNPIRIPLEPGMDIPLPAPDFQPAREPKFTTDWEEDYVEALAGPARIAEW